MHGLCPRIALGCDSLDKMLGGGLESGVITMIFGEAGSGKTNFALQAAISCIRSNKSKAGVRAALIDTEGGFSPERFLQMASKKELERLILFEPKSFAEQSTAIAAASELVSKDKIGLLILDSAVALYRLEMCDERAQQTNRALARQLWLLSKVAREREIPVLVTDQVYSNFKSKDVCAVGGDVLKYVSKCIIRLEKLRGARRRALLIKHRSLPDGRAAEFKIRSAGLVGKERKLRLF